MHMRTFREDGRRENSARYQIVQDIYYEGTGEYAGKVKLGRMYLFGLRPVEDPNKPKTALYLIPDADACPEDIPALKRFGRALGKRFGIEQHFVSTEHGILSVAMRYYYNP